MFKEIETQFKEKSYFRKTTNILLTITGIYYFVGLVVLYLLKANFWWWIVFVVSIMLVIYVYVIIINFKNSLYKNEKKSKIIDFSFNVNEFKRFQQQRDIETLIEISKLCGINTKSKLAQVIDHYRTLLPRNSTNTSSFLSILTLVITIGIFIYDTNSAIENFKSAYIYGIIFLCFICYLSISYTFKFIGNIYSDKSLYTRLEEMYTNIYINQFIK